MISAIDFFWNGSLRILKLLDYNIINIIKFGNDGRLIMVGNMSHCVVDFFGIITTILCRILFIKLKKVSKSRINVAQIQL